MSEEVEKVENENAASGSSVGVAAESAGSDVQPAPPQAANDARDWEHFCLRILLNVWGSI